MTKKKFNVLELFAGAGGLALGLEKAGFNAVGLVEIDKTAVETLRLNRPQWKIFHENISLMVQKNIKTYINEEIDLISGGFPCQPFSYAGKRLGLKDTRGTLFFEFAKIIQEIKPKMFLMENVKGLVNHDKGKTFQSMLNILKKLGYNISWKVLNALNFDVPQKRNRLFVIGIKKEYNMTFVFPKPQTRILTLKDALKDVPDSVSIKYSEKKRRVLALVPPGGCWRDLPAEIAKEYMGKSYYLGGGRTGMARRLSWDEPSLTLTCSPSQSQTERCHPDEIRPFTTREYARIQTFPDDWKFAGTVNNIYKQIGNAVPVNLAYNVGLELIKYFEKIEKE